MNNMNMNNGMNYYPPYYPPYYPQPYPYSTPYYPNHCCCHSHCCQQPQPMNSFNVFDFNSISPSSSLQSFLDMVEHACKASMQATSNEQQQEALSQLLLAFYQAGYSAGKYSNFMWSLWVIVKLFCYLLSSLSLSVLYNLINLTNRS